MKIVIVMEGFFPGQKYGGPPVSVDNLCKLMNNHDWYIVTHNHDMGESNVYSEIETGWNNRNNCKVQYLSDKEYGYKRFDEILREIKPDVIYLQGLFQKCIVPCLILAKKHNIPVILAPRGELCKGAFKKKYKKIPYIVVLKTLGLLNGVYFQSTSNEETLAIEQFLGVKKERIFLLNNVPTIPENKDLKTDKKSGYANLIFISRIVPKKNLLAAIEYLGGVKGNVQFDIYGALEDESYWRECKAQIAQLPPNINVEYKGLINHDQVHNTFRKYDAFIFPTYSENFGHVIAEALMVGCPIIISDQTPWTDVSKIEGGWSIPLDDFEQYVQAIQTVVDADERTELLFRKNILDYIEKKMNLKSLKEIYTECFSKMLK